jgi:hypothetical protein
MLSKLKSLKYVNYALIIIEKLVAEFLHMN